MSLLRWAFPNRLSLFRPSLPGVHRKSDSFRLLIPLQVLTSQDSQGIIKLFITLLCS